MRSSAASSRKLCADRFDLAQGSGFGERQGIGGDIAKPQPTSAAKIQTTGREV
jgi:hypothetical protein